MSRTPDIIRKGSASFVQLPTQYSVIRVKTNTVKYVALLIDERVPLLRRTNRKGINEKKIKNGKGNGGNEIPINIPLTILSRICFLFSFLSAGVRYDLNKSRNFIFFFSFNDILNYKIHNDQSSDYQNNI